MSADVSVSSDSTENPVRPRRSLWKMLAHWLRRGHLYSGLFLIPWTILYGLTAVLFNHPTLLSDQPTATYGTREVAGTSIETLPTAREQALQVLEQLNATQKPAIPYQLAAGEIGYNREYAFAIVKAEGQTINLLLDVKNGGGTVRATPDKPKVEMPTAPFATGESRGNRAEGRAPAPGGAAPSTGGIHLTNPINERFQNAIPTILERTGFPTGKAVVTSVPDVVFPVEAGGAIWVASYNPMTGIVSGKPVDAEVKPELSPRRFLTRLHSAHGFPGDVQARWVWALIVDGMAAAMVFWACSGLFLWWRVKAARRVGALVLLVSAMAATVLGYAMYGAMSQ